MSNLSRFINNASRFYCIDYSLMQGDMNSVANRAFCLIPELIWKESLTVLLILTFADALANANVISITILFIATLKCLTIVNK